MPARSLILVRHGQSEGNVAAESAERERLERIAVPSRDPDITLSELGREQADAVGRWLADLPEDERPEIVWTSPYRRARETAEIAMDVTHRAEIASTSACVTVSWDHRHAQPPGSRPHSEEAGAGRLGSSTPPPGGESWADVALRVRGVLTDLANTERHDRVLVAAHDVVIMLFTYVAEGLDEETVLERARTDGLKNAAICRLDRDEDSPTGWVVSDYNIDTHLRDLGVEVTAQPGASDEVGADRG